MSVGLAYWLCPDCGDVHKFPDNGDKKQCVRCSALCVPMDGLDVTPNDKLRELVEEWESYGYQLDSMGRVAENTREECIDELREVFEQ